MPLVSDARWRPPAARQVSHPSVDTFTLFCYNTLCEKYAVPQTYAYTPSWALSWDYRKDLLLQDILNYNADIVCLQVSASRFSPFLRDNAASDGTHSGRFLVLPNVTMSGCRKWSKASLKTSSSRS